METEIRRHSVNCDPACISGDQLKAALQGLGLWFNGEILSVKLGYRRPPDHVVFPGHASAWYAEAELAVPGSFPYETRKIWIPVHPGEPEQTYGD